MRLNTYLFILIFTILACSNESADDGNNNNGNVESDGVLISSITSSGQNSEYQYVSHYTYDGTKIVSRLILLIIMAVKILPIFIHILIRIIKSV